LGDRASVWERPILCYAHSVEETILMSIAATHAETHTGAYQQWRASGAHRLTVQGLRITP